MPLPDATILQRIEQIHGYLIATGHITTQWFFFTGVINATVAGLLVGLRRTQKARRLPKLFVVTDLALAAMYCPLVPIYYCLARGNIATLTARLDADGSLAGLSSAFPFGFWVATSLALAAICTAMAGLWYYFFLTAKGRRRLSEFANE